MDDVQAKLMASLEEDVQHAELPETVEPPPEPAPQIPDVPVQAVATQLGDVAADSVRLAELQFRLFEVEFRQSATQMAMPVGVLAATGIVVLASTILLVLGLGTGLHELTGWPLSVSQILVSIVGIAIAGGAAWYAFELLKAPRISFVKSKEELMRNIEFFSRMIKTK